MKANELRIGNYVNYQIGTSMFQGQVTTITKTRIVVGDVTSKFMSIQPIPLTKEWLINFGFENKPDIDNGTYHTTVFEKDGVALLFFMGNYDECSINGDLEFDFTYIHTLQNFWHLFRKQELKIK